MDIGILFDLTSPSGQFMLTMLAGLAQMEKVIIAERRDAGIARAKAQGKHCGRPRETPGDYPRGPEST